jgi:hypothetical protein
MSLMDEQFTENNVEDSGNKPQTFDESYNLLLERFKRTNARYNASSGRDARGIRGHERSTKHRQSAQYKRNVNRGNNIDASAMMRNISKKANARIGISKGLGGTLKRNADGKRTTKKKGKFLNSKLPFLVHHVLPNGDIVVSHAVKTRFDRKIKTKFKKIL